MREYLLCNVLVRCDKKKCASNVEVDSFVFFTVPYTQRKCECDAALSTLCAAQTATQMATFARVAPKTFINQFQPGMRRSH